MSIPFEEIAEACGLVGVFPHDLGSGPYTQFIIIYIPRIISVFKVIKIGYF